MAASKRHQVTIKRKPTPAESHLDRHGQVRGAAVTVLADVPCSIEQLSGIELIRAQRVHASATYRVALHAYPGHQITSKCWLEWDTRILHVAAVLDPEGTSRELELLCGEEL